MTLRTMDERMAEESLDRLVESLSQINVSLEGLRISLTQLHETRTDHEQRIRAIEKWKHALTSLIAVIAFLLGAIFTATAERAVNEGRTLWEERGDGDSFGFTDIATRESPPITNP